MNRKPSDWLKYVKMHVHDGVPMTKLAAKYQFDVAKLKYKVKVYLLHGESPFTDEQEKRGFDDEYIVKKNPKCEEFAWLLYQPSLGKERLMILISLTF